MASIAALALLALLAGSARSAVGQAGAGFGRSHPLIGSPRVRHSGGDAFGEVQPWMGRRGGYAANPAAGGPSGEAPPLWCEAAPTTLLSMRESGGFFCDDDASWHKRKDIAIAQQAFQQRTSPTGMMSFYQENWEPDFSCTYERRVGNPGDGGKWICDPHKLKYAKDCLIYSFGSENKFDFEVYARREMGEHCEIHTFDHTIGQNPSQKPDFVNFHPWGIGTGSRTRLLNSPLKSLSEIVTALGHWDRQIHVFKIDVEGAEFDALPPMLDDGTFAKLNIQQIQIEVHRSSPQKVHRLMRSFRNAGYAIFHKEPNIQFPMSGQDVCVEYAFIKLNNSFWQ